jgi:DNA-binding CsgD family transcriptional regulator
MGQSASIVGRDIELARLDAALSVGGQMILVTGEAGIGKTRLVSEAIKDLGTARAVVLMGGCLPLAEKLPLLPIAEALREFVRAPDSSLLDAVMAGVPPYVVAEVGRLVPRLGKPGQVDDVSEAEWRRERLFTAVGELLEEMARRGPLTLVVEDVQWADDATLDCLTYLTHATHRPAYLVTCRTDETSLDPPVAAWVNHARRQPNVEEIRLSPLAADEVAQQAAAILGATAPTMLVGALQARGEGNPFFIEQLMAAAVTGSHGELRLPQGVPTGLAELLVARTRRVSAGARRVLEALAVGGRPETEALIADITGMDGAAVRTSLKELAATRLLADRMASGAYRARHALLAEAVLADLLPSERSELHGRAAESLERLSDTGLAAEIAGHWAAAGRRTEELRSRLGAADAAERMFAYDEAATHWLRAIQLCRDASEQARPSGLEVPRLYLHAVDALGSSGDGVRAGEVVEEALRLFADYSDRAVAAAIHYRAGRYRAIDSAEAGLELVEDALRLFEGAPPSTDHAAALLELSNVLKSAGHEARCRSALRRALEVADAAGASDLVARIISRLAHDHFTHAELEQGFALLERAWPMVDADRDANSVLWLANIESDVLLKTQKLDDASRVALRHLDTVRRSGRARGWAASVLAANAAEALLGLGRIAEAAAVLEPRTSGPAARDQWVLDLERAHLDLLRGDMEAAERRIRQIQKLPITGDVENVRAVAQIAAEIELWRERPADALHHVEEALKRLGGTDEVQACGSLLVLGMRACAELAEAARAGRDEGGVQFALAAADGIARWRGRQTVDPLRDSVYFIGAAAERATWNSERARLANSSRPGLWELSARQWDALSRPHHAAYAWWRQAEVQLLAGEPLDAAALVLRSAVALAEGHVPLMTKIRALSRRARISLDTPSSGAPAASRTPDWAASYGLTARELLVLRLLAGGRTNAEIGKQLFISPKTASVHVTHILRKLGVANRVQAATVAERAGLTDDTEWA